MNLDNLFEVIGSDSLKVIYNKRRTLLNKWKKYYVGKDEDFHTSYFLYKERRLEINLNSLNFAKKICEDWATLIGTPKIDLRGNLTEVSSAEEKLNEILDNSNFIELFPDLTEECFAFGSAVTLLETDSAGDIVLKNLPAFNIIPYKFKKGVVSELITFETYFDKDKYITDVSIRYENGLIKYLTFVSDNGNDIGELDLSFSQISDDLFDKEQNMFVNEKFLGLNTFFIFKPKIVNNLDNNPMGISIFANSISNLQAIDNIFNGFNIEYELSRKKIFIAQHLIENGLYNAETGIYQVSTNAIDGDLIKEINFEIRHESYIKGLSYNLNLLTGKVGFGSNYYDMNVVNGKSQTAVEVLSEKSNAYNNMIKHSNGFKKTLEKLISTILQFYKLNDKIEITVKFENNLIVDKLNDRREDRIDISYGLMSPRAYIQKYNEIGENETEMWLEESLKFKKQNLEVENVEGRTFNENRDNSSIRAEQQSAKG